jgi:hypothetical protein
MACQILSTETDSAFVTVLAYLYGNDVVQAVTKIGGRTFNYGVAVPSEDLKILRSEYDNDQCPIASAKALILAYYHLLSLHKLARQNGGQWDRSAEHSPAWWEQSRKNLAAKQRGRA